MGKINLDRPQKGWKYRVKGRDKDGKLVEHDDVMYPEQAVDVGLMMIFNKGPYKDGITAYDVYNEKGEWQAGVC